jgi:superfamily II DNA/RNA helicase
VGRAGHGGGFGEAFTLVSPREEEQWPRFRSVTGAPVEKIDPPDYKEWVRVTDLDRISRTRDGRKALTQLKLKTKSKDRGEGRKPTRKGGRSRGGSSAFTQSKKPKSAKDSSGSDPKFGARGNAVRRESKRRRIAKGERPGSGVRSVNRPE